ncbi:ABC transporter ATP-binding protein [Clostridium sp. DL1XJH146]
MGELILRNLNKTYKVGDKNVHALRDINLNIPIGSFVTIVGKSGCGKSTLLRLLCDLEKKTSGSIEYKNNRENKSPKIATVFQEPRLMPWLTVEDNIAFSLNNYKDKDHVNAIVNKYLKLLGLYDFRKAYPAQISGGMAQRTALGRTLCYDPDIILMDEPLGALDYFNRKKLQKELVNIFQKTGKTIIFVTHDVDEAIYLGQKVVIIDKGYLKEIVDVNMKYSRDSDSNEFLNLRKYILNTFNKF